jgi:hypothetical protein
MHHHASRFGILACLCVAACASQSGAQQASNGLTVRIADEAKCHAGAEPASAAADAELCKGLVTSLKSELGRAGFTMTDDRNNGGALTLRLAAFAKPSVSFSKSSLTVSMRVDARGQEIESISEGSTEEARHAEGQVASVARLLAEALAGSPRVRHQSKVD